MITVILILLLLYFWIKSVKRRDLPPGPTPLPIIGNAHQLLWGLVRGKTHVDVMLEWKKLYGNVFTMYIGPYHNVVLANYKTVMEAFIRNSEDYANRPEFFLFNEIRNNKGISFASGPGWLEQRRFSLKTLRDFGFGRNIIQQRIMEEFSYRTEKLDKELDDLLGKALIMDPHIFLDLMISSIINRILVGYRYNEKRWDEFVKLRLGLEKEFDTLNVWDGAYLNKNTYKLPGLHYRYMMVEEQQEVLMEHMRDVIKKRRDGIASGEYQLNYEHGGDDYLDAYFIMLEQKKRNEEFIGWFSDEALAANLADLWMAGTTTTLQSLSWFLVFTTNNMAVQEKLRNECFSITNRNRTVALADRPHMPYTSAVITELLRCGNILNFSFLRETTRETVVEGHVLPKKANVVAQISLMFRDDRDYPNPFEFDPERFLNNKECAKHVIAFGAGKRVCVGESLARAELFLLITNLAQKYRWSPVKNCPPSKDELSTILIMRKTRPFRMKIEKLQHT